MAGSTLRNLKDKAAEFVLKQFVNSKIQAYGSLKDIEIDSKNKTLRLELELIGETSPVTVEGTYALSRSGAQLFISVSKIRTSRQWLTAVLNDHIGDERFPIPKAAALAL